MQNTSLGFKTPEPQDYADLEIFVGDNMELIETEIKRVDSTFVYEQAIPEPTWTITHNLNKHPSVSVVDSGGSVVEGGVKYISNNQIELYFTAAFSGKAYLN